MALTPGLLGHGHEVAVGNIPQVLRSLGESQGIGRDGSSVGTQGPNTCFLPQEGVRSDDGGFLGESGEEGQESWTLGFLGRKGESWGPGKGKHSYHFLLQLLCNVILEDSQPMLKGDDHKGCERHSLIISHQAPLVEGDGEKMSARSREEQGGAGTALPPLSPNPKPACPCVKLGRGPGMTRPPAAGTAATWPSPAASQVSRPPAPGPDSVPSAQTP